ncbi:MULTISPECIES: SH3 domain-containing protein [Streptomyces]|uniref:SH3 domain-containing protein n=1 Tax=Streptomyces TaxID=1883 RepID=UPI002250F596|nr:MULTISPECIES: SH3 domain-containing protein [Streptomyces]MCX5278121.1 SH3 domain-containing protein [Streptomyces virginiae]
MRPLIRKTATSVASLALVLGGGIAMASPAAAAVGSSACTQNMADYNGWASTTINLRSGPGTGYTSLGLLRTDTSLRVYCWKGDSWAYTKVMSGANAGRTGWVHTAYINVQMNLS